MACSVDAELATRRIPGRRCCATRCGSTVQPRVFGGHHVEHVGEGGLAAHVDEQQSSPAVSGRRAWTADCATSNATRYVNFYIGDEECRGLGGAGAQVWAGTEVRIIPSVAGG